MLHKILKKALDKLDVSFWQKALPVERSEEFQKWVSQLPKNSPSLPDEAFDRDDIYD
jgi:hypothetical protein